MLFVTLAGQTARWLNHGLGLLRRRERNRETKKNKRDKPTVRVLYYPTSSVSLFALWFSILSGSSALFLLSLPLNGGRRSGWWEMGRLPVSTSRPTGLHVTVSPSSGLSRRLQPLSFLPPRREDRKLSLLGPEKGKNLQLKPRAASVPRMASAVPVHPSVPPSLRASVRPPVPSKRFPSFGVFPGSSKG